MHPESLGAVLKEARRRRGLRVKDVAARTAAKISPSYLSCIENDLRYPSEELLLELAELLGLDPVALYRLMVRAKAPHSIREQIFQPGGRDASWEELRGLTLGELVEQASHSITIRRDLEQLRSEHARVLRAAPGGAAGDAAAQRWTIDRERYRVEIEKLTLSAELDLDGDAVLHRHFMGVRPRPGKPPLVALQHTARATQLPGAGTEDEVKILERPADLAIEIERVPLSPQRSLIRIVFPDGFAYDPACDAAMSYTIKTRIRRAFAMEWTPPRERSVAEGQEHIERSQAVVFLDKPCEELEIDVVFPRHYFPDDVAAWAGTQEYLEADDNLIDEGVCTRWELDAARDHRVVLRVHKPLVGTRFGITWRPMNGRRLAEVRERLDRDMDE